MEEEKILSRQMAVYLGVDNECRTVSIVQYGDDGDQDRHYVEISYDNLPALISRLQRLHQQQTQATEGA